MSILLKLTVENRISEIPRVLDAVDGVFDALPPDDDSRFAMKLAIDEVLTNIIQYAFPETEHHHVRLEMRAEGDFVHCTMEDGGPAFDPLARAAPDLDLDVEDREIGGLGIHFAKESMQKLRYERQDGRNVLYMARRLGLDTGST